MKTSYDMLLDELEELSRKASPRRLAKTIPLPKAIAPPAQRFFLKSAPQHIVSQPPSNPTELYWRTRAALGADQLTKAIAPAVQHFTQPGTTEGYWLARASQLQAV
jgi:hypothetical protein